MKLSEYDKQANKFLKVTDSTLEVRLADPQKAPLWAVNEIHGNHYIVTLKSPRGAFTFDYWDSIANAKQIKALQLIKNAQWGDISSDYYQAQDELKEIFGKKLSTVNVRRHYDEYEKELHPRAYPVLACLNLLYSDSFEDFCAEYGYDTDSITASKTYSAMQEQDRMLRRLYTLDELELLEGVN